MKKLYEKNYMKKIVKFASIIVIPSLPQESHSQLGGRGVHTVRLRQNERALFTLDDWGVEVFPQTPGMNRSHQSNREVQPTATAHYLSVTV